MSARTEPILLEMVTREGPNCPVCSQSLSWSSAGVYVCDICESAAAQGKTIEEVRAEVEDLARGFTARFGSAAGERCTCGQGDGGFRVVDAKGATTGFIDMEVEHQEGCPLTPSLMWGPIDEEWRAWQDENAPRAAELHGDTTAA